MCGTCVCVGRVCECSGSFSPCQTPTCGVVVCLFICPLCVRRCIEVVAFAQNGKGVIFPPRDTRRPSAHQGTQKTHTAPHNTNTHTALRPHSHLTQTPAMSFSAAMVDNFKEGFALFDVKGHGVVDVENLGRVMRAVGLEPSEAELHNMITEVDGSGKGAVDFAEFMKMMARNGVSTSAEIKETFSLFNTSGSGQISQAELKVIMTKLGEKVSDQDLDEMIRVADKSGAGGVSFADFEKCILGEDD
eukprot:m.28754 g.28754  ORF g.28754 m.28754 type:complete len:246 (+) comp8925_c0_seq1:1936-2673(+)